MDKVEKLNVNVYFVLKKGKYRIFFLISSMKILKINKYFIINRNVGDFRS